MALKYDTLRAKAKSRCDKEVAEAKRKYDQTLEALLVVEREFGQAEGDQPKARRGGLADAVQEIVVAISSPFTVKDVRDAMKTRFPDLPVNQASLASALKRIVDVMPSIETQKFGGRKPSVFWKIIPGMPRPERDTPTSQVGSDTVRAFPSEQDRRGPVCQVG